MNRTSYAGLIAVAVFTLTDSAAFAQSQLRTWVSGTGDDVNPCSRIAPCKTFQGAIGKTAAHGQVNCLDSAGFGIVTIIKAISIICDTTEGGVLVNGNDAVSIRAGATDIVYLSGLDVEGGNSNSIGVNFVSGGALHIVNSKVRGFNTAGVWVQPSTGVSEIYVVNSTISDNSGGNLLLAPTGTGSIEGSLRNVSLLNGGVYGLKADGSAGSTASSSINVGVADSTISGNGAGGVVAASAGSPVSVMVENSTIMGNTQGVTASGTAGSIAIRVGGSIVSGNGTGFKAAGVAQVVSYKNNYVDGNTSLGSFTSISPQ